MPTISQFLISRLKGCGVNHAFGVPGDFVLNFYKQLSDNISVIGTTDEQCAGFAADAYARVNGIGCVCVTYCVGGFKLINPIGGAFAEKSPVVVISGSPGRKERSSKLLIHHAVGSYNTQHEIFKHITCASCVLDNPVTAGYEIERVLLELNRYKKPVYIELPRDMIDVSINNDVYAMGSPKAASSDKVNLNEALTESVEWIKSSKKPVILAGIEISRFGMGETLTKFARKYNIPIATTLLSKSLTNESHPLSLGVYCGDASNSRAKEYVETSDCVIMLGVLLTDINFGFKPMALKKHNVVFCTTEKMSIRNHNYDDILFQDFVVGLLESNMIVKGCTLDDAVKEKALFKPMTNSKVTVKRLFEKINAVLNKNMAVITDIGDSLFGATDLVVHHSNTFLAQAFYTSMGFAIPAALGVNIAKPELRPLVIVGDGAFQMTGMEISTIAKHNLNPIIIVMNNSGYTVERFLIDGEFNNIPSWNYHRLPEAVIGKGQGTMVRNEEELESAFNEALASKELFIINVILDPMDKSATLERMTSKLSKIV